MGNYIIQVNGHGQHHNSVHEDADALGAQLVYALRAVGHTVDEASIRITNYQYEGGDKESLLEHWTSADKAHTEASGE